MCIYVFIINLNKFWIIFRDHQPCLHIHRNSMHDPWLNMNLVSISISDKEKKPPRKLTLKIEAQKPKIQRYLMDGEGERSFVATHALFHTFPLVFSRNVGFFLAFCSFVSVFVSSSIKESKISYQLDEKLDEVTRPPQNKPFTGHFFSMSKNWNLKKYIYFFQYF